MHTWSQILYERTACYSFNLAQQDPFNLAVEVMPRIHLHYTFLSDAFHNATMHSTPGRFESAWTQWLPYCFIKGSFWAFYFIKQRRWLESTRNFLSLYPLLYLLLNAAEVMFQIVHFSLNRCWIAITDSFYRTIIRYIY